MQLLSRSTVVWLVLITLTGISAYIGEFSVTDEKIIAFIVIALVIKAQLVVDYFMGLKEVRTLWRVVMSAFAALIGSVMFLTYLAGS